MRDMLTSHFSKQEMACKCRRPNCDAKPMSQLFMQKLEALRVAWGIPLIPTSAARCRFWNEKKGGSPKSQHLLGKAADFWFDNSSDLLAFVELAEKLGFGGVGAGEHLVHVDTRNGFARWTYDNL